MIKEITIREGSTDYIDFQLFSGTRPVDLSANQDVELILSDRNGTIKRFRTGDSKLLITELTLGKLQLRPAANDFYYNCTPYRGYFWVYYSPIKRGAFPEDGMITINVSKALACPNSSPFSIGARIV